MKPGGSNILNVYFTQPVNVNSELSSYYELIEGGNVRVTGSFSNMSVKAKTSENTCVQIYLKDYKLADGAEYTLRVSGELTSAYGVKLNDGTGDNIDFRGRAGELGQLAVAAIKALDSRAVEIEFNAEIDEFYSQQFLNYMLKSQDGTVIGVNKAVLAVNTGRKGSVVVLGIQGTLDRAKNYEVTVNYLTDSLKRTVANNLKASFSGAYDENTDLHITGHDFSDKGTVTIQLDKPLDADSAENITYYSVTGITDTNYSANPVKVLYHTKDGKYLAKLYFADNKALLPGSSYRIKVSREMQYYQGSKSVSDALYDITAGNAENSKPVISQAMLISGDAIKITTSEEIALEAPNISPANYTLEYKAGNETIRKIPLSIVTVDGDYKILILKFDALDTNTYYTLKCISLKDYGSVQTNIGQNAINVTVGK